MRCAIARIDLWCALETAELPRRTLLADRDHLIETDHQSNVLDDLRPTLARLPHRAQSRALLLYFSSSAAERARSSELNAWGGMRTVSRISTMMNMASPTASLSTALRVLRPLGSERAPREKNDKVRVWGVDIGVRALGHCASCFALRAGRPLHAPHGARLS